MKGKTFKGCVEYVLGKEKAELLDSDGLLTENVQSIVSGFATQRLLNPRIKQPVGHVSLAYSIHDKARLTNPKMIQLAHEYMQAMGIENTQYIIVRHNDSEHPHVHIVYNRIDHHGRTISDKNDRYRNEKVCKMLKEKHGLYFARGKENVQQERLRGNDKTKYQIYSGIKEGLSVAGNWKEFETHLNKKEISITFKYKGNTDMIQGISFTKNGITFKGSEIDRNFSYSKLNARIIANAQNRKKESTIPEEHTKKQSYDTVAGLGGLFSDLLNEQPQHQEPYDPFKYRKKKKKKGLTR